MFAEATILPNSKNQEKCGNADERDSVSPASFDSNREMVVRSRESAFDERKRGEASRFICKQISSRTFVPRFIYGIRCSKVRISTRYIRLNFVNSKVLEREGRKNAIFYACNNDATTHFYVAPAKSYSHEIGRSIFSVLKRIDKIITCRILFRLIV